MDWGFIIAVVVTGLIVVFAALILLIVCIYVINAIIGLFTKRGEKKSGDDTGKTAAPKAAGKQAVTQAAVVEPGISGGVVAAIAAAIAMLTGGKKAIIRSIKRSGSNRSVWASAGIAENTKPF